MEVGRDRRWHLQVEDVVLGVQVDAHGLLLDGHDGEAHVDAAMELPLLHLQERGQVSLCVSLR